MSRSIAGTGNISVRRGQWDRRSPRLDPTRRPNRFARPLAKASTARYGRLPMRTILIGKHRGTDDFDRGASVGFGLRPGLRQTGPGGNFASSARKAVADDD